jgi:hypothetical protein
MVSSSFWRSVLHSSPEVCCCCWPLFSQSSSLPISGGRNVKVAAVFVVVILSNVFQVSGRLKFVPFEFTLHGGKFVRSRSFLLVQGYKLHVVLLLHLLGSLLPKMSVFVVVVGLKLLSRQYSNGIAPSPPSMFGSMDDDDSRTGNRSEDRSKDEFGRQLHDVQQVVM